MLKIQLGKAGLLVETFCESLCEGWNVPSNLSRMTCALIKSANAASADLSPDWRIIRVTKFSVTWDAFFWHQDALLLNKLYIFGSFWKPPIEWKKASWAEIWMLSMILSCCFWKKNGHLGMPVGHTGRMSGLPGACNWKRQNSVLKKAKFWIY